MKTLDRFLLHDLSKLFKKCEIGFVIDDIQAYNKEMPSVRIRCYDIMTAMEKIGINVELYKPYKKYDAVIFTKTRTDAAVKRAQKLADTDTLVISDNFCEYLTDESRADDWERRNILKILKCSDIAFAYSKEQYKQFKQYHKNVYFINEGVNETYFEVHKKHEQKEQVTLIYSGYRSNALHTELIKNAISQLQKEFNCKVTFICEDDPGIKSFAYEYIPYEQKSILTCLLQGDIMIAPRPMKDIEKAQHTLTKIACPMAIGLPVAASPVPSYIDTPALLCYNEREWYKTLRKLIISVDERRAIGEASREYVKKNLSTDVIAKEYESIIKSYKRDK
ncbi:MAG: hypothetical protein NC313_06860 [Butyrivibrio sp.]|nr:hypothetical protein [Butyrivibrio sp.]